MLVYALYLISGGLAQLVGWFDCNTTVIVNVSSGRPVSLVKLL